jgi:hypothetical protein
MYQVPGAAAIGYRSAAVQVLQAACSTRCAEQALSPLSGTSQGGITAWACYTIDGQQEAYTR